MSSSHPTGCCISKQLMITQADNTFSSQALPPVYKQCNSPLAQSPSWKTTICQMSMPSCSIHWHIPSTHSLQIQTHIIYFLTKFYSCKFENETILLKFRLYFTAVSLPDCCCFNIINIPLNVTYWTISEQLFLVLFICFLFVYC